MKKINELSFKETITLLKNKEISPVDLIKFSFDVIDQYEQYLGAFVSLFDRDDLIKQSKESEKRWMKNEPLSLIDGIPIGVKDNIHVVGLNTTCGSNILRNYKAKFNATVVEKIIKAGGIIIGKTNMDEFAMGSTTETSAIKLTRNPFDLNKVPGGSSGGSAVSVSSGMCKLSLGSDTGGSIRQPAAFCGIAGLKPSYGLVSRFGLVSYACSLDQIGPMSKDVYGLAVLMNIIAGYDTKDSTSLDVNIPNYLDNLENNIKGKKFVIIKELYSEGVLKEIRSTFEKTVQLIKDLGATVEEINFPLIKYIIPTYYFIATAEASSNLARYDGVKYGYRSNHQSNYEEMLFYTRSEGFGKEVKKRIMLGNFVLSSGYYDQYYNNAVRIRKTIQYEINKIFENYDAIISPTTPELPFEFGKINTDPLKLYIWDITTTLANLARIPALSIPCGEINGLPVGFQIMGKYLSDSSILNIAYILEKNLNINLTPEININNLDNKNLETSKEFSTSITNLFSKEKVKEVSYSYNNREKNASKRVFCEDLKNYIGKEVVVSGWIHKIYSLGGIEFYILRDRSGYTQLVLEPEEKKKLYPETVIEVNGIVTLEERSPYDNIEIKVKSYNILGHSHSSLPLKLHNDYSEINLNKLLEYRTISVRNEKVRKIFFIQSEIVRLFSEFLRSKNFIEIKTPKIISTGTEGGSNIFEIKYFEKKAFLAQSPQFYKQIMVGSGFERVFEIGPVFRAELHDTVRHLNEYVSMDLEMGFIRDEQDIIDLHEELLLNMFDYLLKKYEKIIKEFNSEIKLPNAFPRIHFLEAMEIISYYGGKDNDGDISPEGERILCNYFEKEKYSSFVYVIGYPIKKRPMYTMPDERLPGYTRSFDLIFRGLEITTGGQRINEYEMLKKNIIKFGANPNNFKSYLDVFKYGMPPHGGLGMGLERVTMKLLNLNNIREASIFPRDRYRIEP